MIEPRILLAIGLLSGFLAATVMVLCAWPWREPRPLRTAAGGVLGVVLAWYAGCWLLEGFPRWPLAEERGRLLLLLIPALLAVELLAVVVRQSALVWPLRLLIAAVAGRILLHGTSSIGDSEGPGTPGGPTLQTVEFLGGMALALLVVWVLLSLLARRTGGSSVVLTLAVTCAGATGTIMLSGNLTINEVGVPLAGALAGTAVLALFLPEGADLRGVVGVGVMGLFALLVVGRFFGKLSTTHALLLSAAPLLAYLPELPWVRRASPGWRGVGRLAFGSGLVAVTLLLAQRDFVRDSVRTSAPPDPVPLTPPSQAPLLPPPLPASISPASEREPSGDDYKDFGK